MKTLLPILLILVVAARLIPAAEAADPTPVKASELESVQAIYAAAQKEEADALVAFREVRAMQSSRALRITLEEARQRLQIPAPERPPIDLSILALARPDPARVVEQRQTLRDVNARIDEILTFVRQLKEQLKEEEIAAETITMQTLLAELATREASDALAAEDENEPSKDMTGAELAGAPDAKAQASVDAAIANQAATEAEKMAKEAEAREKDAAPETKTVAPEAKAVAADARKAAEAATKAAADSKEAAEAKDAKAASSHANTAAAKSAEAVAAAIKVAQITGNISFVAAEKAHSDRAAASKHSDAEGTKDNAKTKEGGSKVGAKDLGGFTPGATKFLPGKARPSRRIGGLGAGIEWIYIDSWYALGPFPNPNRRNVDTSYPPESVIDLDASYTGDQGRNLRWQFIQSPSPYVIPPDPMEYVIYYAYSELWCDQAMDLWVMAGSDDSSRIWVNDQLIWKSGYRLKPWRLNEGLRKVSFRRGLNRILYRIENGWGLLGFSFAINLTPVAESAPAPSGSTTR